MNTISPAQAIPAVRRAIQGELVEGLDDLPYPHQRLIQVLQERSASSPSDRAVLLRHVLRYEDEQSGGAGRLKLRIPRSDMWLAPDIWARYGCQVDAGTDVMKISARSWRPEWLPGSDRTAPAAAAFGEKRRRHFSERPADPFLSVMGESFQSYLSLGQEASVRSALSAPQGSTLVVNLPTGAGKSLCAHLPTALDPNENLTVVVVPTVALAMDQQESIRRVVGHDTAYYSGNESNENIRRRIRNGSQRIVFTSPEGLLLGLAPSVFQAARRGYLKRLVIDEAHIVDEWGNDFRSAFQDLAGMRKGLLDVCDEPFTTLLLSATFREGALRTLNALFGDPGPFEHVSAARLRPEPSYWIHKTDQSQTRIQHILEAIDHLPRPLILYASVREDVRMWYDLLQEAGYSRVDMMTGNSSSRHRKGVLKRWAKDQTDIVVATSAFGLGIDKPNVRAVVHACLPENVNRFYQEVGRGGRDGNASASLLIYYENSKDRDKNGRNDDVGKARGINTKRILKPETAFPRWEAMFDADEKEVATDRSRSHIRVPITATPRLDMDNDANKAWNVRTLILMHRAGLLELQGDAPPRNLDDLSKEERRKQLDAYQDSRLVKLKTAGPRDQEAFEEAMAPIREMMEEENKRGFRDMQALVTGEACVAETLTKVYQVPRKDTTHRDPPVSVPITVAPECGGCPACRARDSWLIASSPESVTMPTWQSEADDLHISLDDLFRDGPLLFVFYSQEDQGRSWSRSVQQVVYQCFQRGIRCVVAPKEQIESWRDQWEGTKDPVFLDTLLSDWPDPTAQLHIPELVYLSEGSDLGSWYIQKGAPRILILPASTRDPRAPHRRLQDTCPGTSIRFYTLKTTLSI